MASKDRNLCESIIKGIDIHGAWRDNILRMYPDYILRLAQMTNQTEEKKILKEGRNIVKADLVFASFFGSTVDSCAKRMQMPTSIAHEVLGEFWHEFAGVKAWIKARRAEYRDTGSITTLTKRVRHAVLWGNEPINTPVQGSAADVVIEAMSELAELARGRGDMHYHPRINIHDDLTFLLPDDDRLPGYIEEIAAILVKPRFDWVIVPLAVEAAVGPNWADLEEFAAFEGKYYR
jgi:DNA polymerase I-like protein with 3'-5' exonuclease and polymerase domains